MRAPFNNTCTLYDGPTTGTPWFPRVVGAECRLVDDQFFMDINAPFSPSVAYMTIASDQPAPPTTLNLGDDKWEFDFGKADRVVLASHPTVTWKVLRVEVCTWPVDGAPYWRATLVEDTDPDVPCVLTYPEIFYVKDHDTDLWHTLTRYLPTAWAVDIWNLDAEVTDAEPPECESTWRLTHGDRVWEFTYSGAGEVIVETTSGPTSTATITDTPP